jgi:hypothetical protein
MLEMFSSHFCSFRCPALFPSPRAALSSRPAGRSASSSSSRQFVDIVCGTGHHSHDGRSKLRDALVALLRDELRLRVEERGGAARWGGTLRATLPAAS